VVASVGDEEDVKFHTYLHSQAVYAPAGSTHFLKRRTTKYV